MEVSWDLFSLMQQAELFVTHPGATFLLFLEQFWNTQTLLLNIDYCRCFLTMNKITNSLSLRHVIKLYRPPRSHSNTKCHMSKTQINADHQTLDIYRQCAMM